MTRERLFPPALVVTKNEKWQVQRRPGQIEQSQKVNEKIHWSLYVIANAMRQ